MTSDALYDMTFDRLTSEASAPSVGSAYAADSLDAGEEENLDDVGGDVTARMHAKLSVSFHKGQERKVAAEMGGMTLQERFGKVDSAGAGRWEFELGVPMCRITNTCDAVSGTHRQDAFSLPRFLSALPSFFIFGTTLSPRARVC